MTYAELPFETRLSLDALSPSEFQELMQNHTGQPGYDVLEHYRETYLWWADVVIAPNGDELDIDPPDHVPSPERLHQARDRGTFIL